MQVPLINGFGNIPVGFGYFGPLQDAIATKRRKIDDRYLVKFFFWWPPLCHP